MRGVSHSAIDRTSSPMQAIRTRSLVEALWAADMVGLGGGVGSRIMQVAGPSKSRQLERRPGRRVTQLSASPPCSVSPCPLKAAAHAHISETDQTCHTAMRLLSSHMRSTIIGRRREGRSPQAEPAAAAAAARFFASAPWARLRTSLSVLIRSPVSIASTTVKRTLSRSM